MMAFARLEAPSVAARSERVLLAEENDEVRDELAAELRSCGHRVIEVADGLELRDYLQSAGTGNRPLPAPTVIISEASMSGCGGLDVLADLRSAHSSTPFVLLNSQADPRVEEQARALHASCVFCGPVKPSALSRLLALLA